MLQMEASIFFFYSSKLAVWNLLAHIYRGKCHYCLHCTIKDLDSEMFQAFTMLNSHIIPEPKLNLKSESTTNAIQRDHLDQDLH